MKIISYPRRDVVLGQLKEKLLEAEDQVADDIAALDTILASVIVRSATGEELARANLNNSKANRERLEDIIELIESDEGAVVRCEIEDP